jgi:hypothetical protein
MALRPCFSTGLRFIGTIFFLKVQIKTGLTFARPADENKRM